MHDNQLHVTSAKQLSRPQLGVVRRVTEMFAARTLETHNIASVVGCSKKLKALFETSDLCIF